MKKVVVIGGGTGTFTVLSGLRDSGLEVTAIVSTADDGGSTGILRDELGVLPPGDIRQALVALSADSSMLRELFGYRFHEGSLAGHSFGNLFLSALEKVTGSFDKAVLEAGKILAIKGLVLPVTSDKVYLRAETENGQIIKGEHTIENFIWSEQGKVNKIWLEPDCKIHPLARTAIRQADLIVIAPGSIFTSLIPNLLVKGMQEELALASAPLVYICNLMTEKGQTGSFFVQDFADLIQSYLGKRQIDYVLYNKKLPNEGLLENYKKEMERSPVLFDSKRKKHLAYRTIATDLLEKKPSTKKVSGDKLGAMRTLIRHDSAKLAAVIQALTTLKEVQKYISNA